MGLTSKSNIISDNTSKIITDIRKTTVLMNNVKKERSNNPRKELNNQGISWEKHNLADAYYQGDIKVVELFLKGGMQANVQDQDRFSALPTMILHNKENVISVLRTIAKYTSINMNKVFKISPSNEFVVQKKKLLKKQRIRLVRQQKRKRKEESIRKEREDQERYRQSLREYQVRVKEHYKRHGISLGGPPPPVYLPAPGMMDMEHNIPNFSSIMDSNPDLIFMDHEYSEITLLIAAVWANDIELVRYLIKQGADPDKKVVLLQHRPGWHAFSARSEATRLNLLEIAAHFNTNLGKANSHHLAMHKDPAQLKKERYTQDGNSHFTKNTHESLEKLLLNAQKQIARKKLSTPKNDCALTTYKIILSVDPTNKEAKSGIIHIANQYANWAEKNVKKENLIKAKKYIRKAKEIYPSGNYKSINDLIVKLINTKQKDPIPESNLNMVEQRSKRQSAPIKPEKYMQHDKRVFSKTKDEGTKIDVRAGIENIFIGIGNLFGGGN